MRKALIPGLLAALALLQLTACTEGDSDETGTAGTGAPSTGSAGTGVAGTGASTTTGSAGTGSGTGAAGTVGAVGTGAAGTTGAAGSMGAAGTTGGAGTGATNQRPSGPSAGCEAAVEDNVNQWVEHQVTVPVAAQYQAMYANRRYFTRLPTGYDPSKPYPVVVWGQGCGAKMVENTPMTNSDATQYIQVFMLQVGDCFSTGPADSPELAYFDMAVKGTQDGYCTDKGKVFIGGFSSGSWLANMLGCHRATVLRGTASASGGLGANHHECTGPVAAILTADTSDTTNPIVAVDTTTKLPKGSAAARDRLLMTNGCSMTETKPWDAAFPACVAYQGCMPNYPVVWCPTMTTMGHWNGGMYSSKAFWKFWSSLP